MHEHAPVVFVATENNTIYVIQPVPGKILLSRNLGPPVPRSMLPGRCQAGGVNLGINSTPVIDLERRTLYVITYTLENGVQTYLLHALNLADLSDRIPPIVVAASHTLADGTTYSFNAAV